jgi:uncharacterized protein (DUF983 family)
MSESKILGLNGKPIAQPKSSRCPKCGAGADRRVLSAGFGEPHDVCGTCGFEWEERTL